MKALILVYFLLIIPGVQAADVVSPMNASVTQSGLDAEIAPEPGPLAMIGSGLVFLSLIASATRKRKKSNKGGPANE
jgi:hypothetical protein